MCKNFWFVITLIIVSAIIICGYTGAANNATPGLAETTPAKVEPATRGNPSENNANTTTKPSLQIRDIYDLMKNDLDLTKEQLDKVMEIRAGIDAWEAENAPAFKQADADMKAAIIAKDKAKTKEALRIKSELQAKRDQNGITSFQQKLDDLLTPKQKAAKAGFMLFLQITAQLSRSNITGLTKEQGVKTKAICMEKGPELLRLKKTDINEYKKIMAEATKRVNDEVLTPEQKSGIRKKPSSPATKPDGSGEKHPIPSQF